MSKGVGKCRYGKWKERAVLGLVCHYQTKHHQAEHPQSPHHSIMALVLALLPNPTGPRNRRQITPALEDQQPKRILAWFSADNHPQNYKIGTTISTKAYFDASQRLLLGDSATVVQINHPPNPTCYPPAAGDQIRHCRHHIVAKERQESSSSVGPYHLFHIFPFVNSHGQAFPSVFIIDLDKLPSSPWPLTIAGNTIDFINPGEQQGRGWPFSIQQPAVEVTNSGQVIDYEWRDRYDYSVMTDAILRRRAKRIDEHFAAFFDNIRPVEVIFKLVSQDLYVVLEDHIDIDGIVDEFPLPSGISESLKDRYSPIIRYVRCADLRRPKPGAPGQQPAEGTVVDTTAYAQLGPGMLLHAFLALEEPSPVFFRTSGVVAMDRHGKRALVSCGLPSFKVIWQGDVGSVCYVGTVEDSPHKVTPPDGTMGSAIWDEEGAVLGFWDCYIPTGLFAGMANAVSASELSGRGFFLMPG